LAGIENISVANFQTDNTLDNTINLSTATGVSKISLSSSADTGDTFFTAVRSLVTAEMSSGAGDLGITYADTVLAGTTVLGTGETQVLNLSGQTAGTFTVAPTTTGVVETISIVSGTSANTVQVTSAGTTTINASGAQNLVLTEGMTDTITRVNASAMTGNLTFTTNDATAISVTGGAGNDAIVLGGTFTVADSVDGGAGSLDSLSISVAVTAATELANVTNVETLIVTGGAAITLAAAVAPTTFTVSDATASIVTLNTGYTGATTVNMGVTDRVVNSANVVTTLNVTAANAISGADISITGGSGVDTLNMTADGSAAFTLASVTLLDRINAVDGGDTAATAGADISITVDAAYATALTVDASALDAGTLTGTTMNADFENLLFDGSAQSTAATVLNVTGGSGADTITGGAGNDIIAGGNGNDSINGAAGGNDSISGGDGVDTINMGAALTSADTIDGGLGTDILTVTSLTAAGLTNVTNVETLSLSGVSSIASLSANLSFTTIDMDTVDNAVQILTLATGYTSPITVLLDSGDRVTNTANTALTVTATAASLVAGSATTITGGTGVDTLNVTADNTTANIVATSGLITLVDVINVVDGGDVTTGTITAGRDITIDLASYATATTALTVDASALDAGTGTGLNTNAEVLTITGTSARALKVTGGGSHDVIVGSNHATIGDSLVGGDGNDTFTMAGNLTYIDTIDGGAGANDTVSTTGTVTDVQFMRVSNVETLTLAAGATLAGYFDAAGIANVTVSTAALVDATGTATGHTFTVSATDAADSVYGGLGADTVVFAGTAQLKATDSIVGNGGSDTIFLNNAAAGVTGVVDFDAVTTVENFTLGTASGLATTSAELISLDVSATITLATVQTINLNGSVITDARDAITIINGNASTTTTFSITGGAGNDVLAGGAGNDTIVGGLGNDTITGNAGVDQLTGGTGNDSFNFVFGDSTVAAFDTVSDFLSASDVLVLDAGTTTATDANVYDFTNKGSAASNTEGISLMSGSGAANATTVRIGQYFFNTANNSLTMDADGNGLIQATDMAIRLTGAAALAAGDLNIIVTAGAASAQTITTGGGADTVTFGALTGVATINTGAGDDTLNTIDDNILTTDVINGGAGNDTLNVTDTGTTTNFTTDANLVLIENVVFATNAITTSFLGQTEALNITTANGTNSVTLGSGASTVTGGTGADTVVVATNAALAAAGSINGGTGADILTISTADLGIVDSSFLRVAAVETLTLTGASTAVLGANATAATIATVITGNAATTITSTQTALTVNPLAITAGLALTLLGSANYTVTQAGTAFDTLVATGSTGTLAATFGDDTGNAVAVTTGNGNTTVTGNAGDVITVTGLLTDTQTFNGITAKFNVTATTGAQTITTGAAVDTIRGGAGGDNITPGGANDVVILAALDSSVVTSTTLATPGTFGGTEAFTFATASGYDRITGFTTGDAIQLYTTGTTAITTVAAVVVAGGVNPAATDGVVAAIRGTQTSTTVFTAATAGLDTLLIWDVDGTGTGAVYAAVVLVGYVDVANDTVSTAGLFTAAAA
jgi:Ca2+-binding RTX toxin-like protein